MKKKVLSLCLVFALVAIAVTGVSLAYFTDTEEAVNNFSIGSIEIELIEYNFHPTLDNKTEEEIKEDAKTYDRHVEDLVPGVWVRKAPYVINKGRSEAYVRVVLRVDKFINDCLIISETTDNSIIPSYKWYDADGNVIKTSDVYEEVADYASIEYVYTYTKIYAPGEMTELPAFWQYKIADELDQDVFVDYIENSTEVILAVHTDAIQAETFSSAVEAFAAFDD